MNLQKKKPLKGWSSRELESEIRLSYCGRVELRCQLADESLKGTEDYDFLFQATTALQKELLEKRLAHKPVAHEGRL